LALDKVQKRDGEIVQFDREKITKAIFNASRAVGGNDKERAARLAAAVVEELKSVYPEEEVPHVEDIQDMVEKVLLEEGLYDTARAYIIYRQQHKQQRREKKRLLRKEAVDSIDKRFSLNALRVLSSRYLLRDDQGELVEAPRELFSRVATTITIPDILRDERVFDPDGGAQGSAGQVGKYLDRFKDYGGKFAFAGHPINSWNFLRMGQLYRELAGQGKMKVDFSRLLELFDEGVFEDYDSQWEDYFQLMVGREFLPNSPTLMNAGTRLGQLSACFVLPVEDDMEDIMDTVKEASLVFQSGGGVGINYSRLRPDGDIVSSTAGVASGPVSFMRIVDTMTEVVKQGGKRRGANMGLLAVDHPDIQDFVRAKEEEGKLENFNISVAVWEDFWQALREGRPFPLVNPRDGDVWEEIDPGQLLETIAHSAWDTADPGMVFFDRVNEYNVLQGAKGAIEGTNPCGEQPLYPYESCNLGSINLKKMIEGGEFNWEKYEETVRMGTRFLDNVLDMNDFPIERIEESTKETRKIGLGVMGLADALYRMEVPYNSGRAYEMMEDLAEGLSYWSMDESVELAKKRGPFPLYEETAYPDGELPLPGYYEEDDPGRDWAGLVSRIRDDGIRNGMHTSVAPTGSISMIADTSNGIEPQFSLAYQKSVTAGDFYYSNEVLEEKLKHRGLYSEELLEEIADRGGNLAGLDDLPQDLKEVFVTAMEIHYSDHLMAQAAWQKWISASISKTINMPKSVTTEDVFNTYLLAHELGLKGVTVYRDGSKSSQVLQSKSDRGEEISQSPSDHLKQYLEEEASDFLSKGIFEGETDRANPGGSDGKKPEAREEGDWAELEEDRCPSCGGKIIHEGGCNKCVECGWSTCSIS